MMTASVVTVTVFIPFYTSCGDGIIGPFACEDLPGIFEQIEAVNLGLA